MSNNNKPEIKSKAKFVQSRYLQISNQNVKEISKTQSQSKESLHSTKNSKTTIQTGKKTQSPTTASLKNSNEPKKLSDSTTNTRSLQELQSNDQQLIAQSEIARLKFIRMKLQRELEEKEGCAKVNSTLIKRIFTEKFSEVMERRENNYKAKRKQRELENIEKEIAEISEKVCCDLHRKKF
jgi:AraC-like DNA-binding protein